MAGLELVRGDETGALTDPKQWSRPEIYNATRAGQSRMMQKPQPTHMNALKRLCHYVLVGTPNRGLVLHPDRAWGGSKTHKFCIRGHADSNYAANTDDRRSVSGGTTFLENRPVIRGATQKFVTLSVTEAETAVGVTCAQDMMYVYQILVSLELSVELPMVLEIDNKGAVDMANIWSVLGGRTRHMEVRMHFLHELKDQGLLIVKHIAGKDNEADIFTKNTPSSVFLKHIPKFVGCDEYMEGKDNTA
eukprot:scaffold2883_cov76-Cyclotella_meneghiniana.AAC.3